MNLLLDALPWMWWRHNQPCMDTLVAAVCGAVVSTGAVEKRVC